MYCVFDICTTMIEPSSEYVIFIDMFEHFGVRWMKIPFLNSAIASRKYIWSFKFDIICSYWGGGGSDNAWLHLFCYMICGHRTSLRS